ncbi:MAG TPA: protein kinase [Bacteroidota bacterium]|nr:protein kinase [Bacteroidota bacterium]
MTGKTFLQYEISGELGRGGMGVVYLARDTRLDRPVALKFLPSHVKPSEHDLARFTQEAKAAAALNHPNVCTIYDIKEHDNLQFIVMEFVDGTTLRKKITGGPLPLSDVLTYGLQIADALQEAHGRGIVHRDIKADNIMVNVKNQVKVMDFGLAKLKGTLKLTRSSSTVGTLAYMAPEQIQGGEVDARSDIFSFGVVLFEMLTARTPFRGEHEAAMMYSILNEEPEPLQKFLPDAPPELLHVMNRALEKNPEDRYQGINEMAIDLRRVKKESSKVSRRSIPSMPAATSGMGIVPESPGQSDHETSRKTTTVTLNIPTVGKGTVLKWVVPAVVVAAGVIGYFTLFTGGEAESGGRIPVAVADFQNQTKEDDLNGLSGMLITSLEQSRRLSVMTRSRMFDVLKQLGKTEVGRIDESLGREICRQANVGALVVASVSKFDQLYIIDMKVLDPEKNEYLLTLKEEGEGKSSIPGMIDKLSEKTRLGLKEKAADIDASNQAVAEMTTPSMEAYQALFRGEEFINKLKFDSAAAEFRHAVAIDSTFAVAHYRLAYALEWSQSPGAEEAIGKAVRYVDRVPKKENYLIRAENALVNNDAELGLSIYKELQALYPEDKEANYLVGDYSFHKRDYRTAEAALRKVLSIDPTFSRAYQHLTWTYMFEKRFGEMRNVARLYAEKVPSQSAYLHLAESFLQEGMFDSALAVCRDAMNVIADDGEIRSFEGTVYLSRHQFDRAASLYRDMAESPAREPERVRYGLTGLVTEAIWAGKFREALRRQDRLIEFETEQKNSTLLATSLASRAYLTVALPGDTSEARTFLARALELKGYGDQFFHSALQAYYVASGDFDRSGEIATTTLIVTQPSGAQLNDALREYQNGNYGSAIRLFRAQTFLFHEELFKLAKSFAATDQPDSALATLSRLKNFYGGTFGFEFNRAFTDVKSEYLTGLIYEKTGDRKQAAEHYGSFLEIWKDADGDIPELVDGKKRLAALETR